MSLQSTLSRAAAHAAHPRDIPQPPRELAELLILRHEWSEEETGGDTGCCLDRFVGDVSKLKYRSRGSSTGSKLGRSDYKHCTCCSGRSKRGFHEAKDWSRGVGCPGNIQTCPDPKVREGRFGCWSWLVSWPQVLIPSAVPRHCQKQLKCQHQNAQPLS